MVRAMVPLNFYSVRMKVSIQQTNTSYENVCLSSCFIELNHILCLSIATVHWLADPVCVPMRVRMHYAPYKMSADLHHQTYTSMSGECPKKSITSLIHTLQWVSPCDALSSRHDSSCCMNTKTARQWTHLPGANPPGIPMMPCQSWHGGDRRNLPPGRGRQPASHMPRWGERRAQCDASHKWDASSDGQQQRGPGTWQPGQGQRGKGRGANLITDSLTRGFIIGDSFCVPAEFDTQSHSGDILFPSR